LRKKSCHPVILSKDIENCEAWDILEKVGRLLTEDDVGKTISIIIEGHTW
jgi:hypothetical protein